MKALLLCVVAASCLFAQPIKLTPEEFVVKPGVARYWKFSVTGDTGMVIGGFRASGGAHNDIRVLIIESLECENYLNGNKATVSYDSGAKTVGKFDVKLDKGGYCIIFDNRNSVVSAKEVAARVSLVNQ